jgi:hypothetical protein
MASSAPALDFSDPAALKTWLDDVDGRVGDLAGAALDRVAPPSVRKLGRAGARDLIHDAHGTLRDLIALARAGLPAQAADPDATPIPEG